jgi:hypothetical protein
MRRPAKRRNDMPLEALPLAAGEVWEGGWGPLSAQLREEEDAEPFHPELAMWVVSRDGRVLASQLAPPGGGAAALVELLPRVMRDPEIGRPRRPGTVRVKNGEALQPLRELLAPLGVNIEEGGAVDDWQLAFDYTNQSISPEVGGYHPTTEEHAEALAALFRAAAQFYRAAPWSVLDERRPLGLHVPSMPEHTFGMMVMGSGGENRGLVVFATLETMGDFVDAVSYVAPEAVDLGDLPPSLSLNFATADEMPPEAVEEAQEHGWEVAAPDAYPLLLASEPGEGVVIDLSPEPLTVMITALQAVNEFWREAEADLRAGKPSVMREVEVNVEGTRVPMRVSCPPIVQGPRRRERKPARGPRGR